MLSPEEVLEYTGHNVGGVCPYANPVGKSKVYLDESMKRFEQMLLRPVMTEAVCI